MTRGQIQIESDDRLLAVELFTGLDEVKRKLNSVEIRSKVMDLPYVVTVQPFQSHHGEETNSVVDGTWRRENKWDIPEAMLVASVKKSRKK